MEIESVDVRAKREAALRWASRVSADATVATRWRYLLVSETDVKDAKGEPVILRKTLQMNYFIRGDDVYPGLDEVNTRPEQWVMR